MGAGGRDSFFLAAWTGAGPLQAQGTVSCFSSQPNCIAAELGACRSPSKGERGQAAPLSAGRDWKSFLPLPVGAGGGVGEGAGGSETDGSLRAKSNRLSSFSKPHQSMSHSSMGGPGERGWVPQHLGPLYSSPWYGQDPLGLAKYPAIGQGRAPWKAMRPTGPWSPGLCLAAVDPAQHLHSDSGGD